ncbi:PDR/VanB family oxidoreductase [Lichenifustis flavocetrariae]|uniref:PDR/VanB family oxidoreductase n=1 Tax=Lichenifustis flavocetrariae TaxID=2949735 RepID=A0AA41YZY1_9HYPH|nr:PDR/VanB family oxidoreductase [Lichenifustis flavocetrariae]MCW6511661.1 PDR/VanB family oxidoreductase [Lichenifustis flavocetrariae]
MSQPRIPVRVTDVVTVTPLVKRFHFAALDGGPLPGFSGGAHIVVEMRDGDILRRNAYSLMGAPSNAVDYTISIRRDQDGRGGSRYLHDHVVKGTTLFISHPANLFSLERRARKHVFLAGGIGITPFVAMAAQAFEEQQAFELHYGVRSRIHAAYADELADLYGNRVKVYASAEGERIPVEAVLGHQPLGTHLYVCGPERLIDGVLTAARALGWPEQSLHSERFVAPAAGAPYRVRLARSGMVIDVGSHQGMLEAIEAAGVDAPYLCRGGACGHCQATVLACDGRLQHHDHFLSEDEKASGRSVMPCVSRFEGELLTLDL